MPSFPAYKTKPYYDSLSNFLAVSIDLATGELKDSAVQEKVSAAIAAEPTVVQAAAAAVDDAVATDPDIGVIKSLDPGEQPRGTISGVQPRRGASLSPADFGGVGDGVTDDYAAIMAVITAFGGDAGVMDLEGREWYSTQPIEINAPVNIIGGSGGSDLGNNYTGGILTFAPDVAGLILRKGWRHGVLRDLTVQGSNTGLGTADGVYIGGVRWRADNIRIKGFSRHGLHLNSDDVAGQNADQGNAHRLHAFWNAGDGIHVAGGADTNACIFEGADVTANGGYGIYNKGNINTFILPHASGNTLGDYYQVDGGLSSVWISPYSEAAGKFIIDRNTTGGYLVVPGIYGRPQIWGQKADLSYEQSAFWPTQTGGWTIHYEYGMAGRQRLYGQLDAVGSRHEWVIDPDYPAANLLGIRNNTTGQDILWMYGDTSNPRAYFRANTQMLDGRNMIFGSTTGTKIGTATNQKIGFYNATPVVQPVANPDTSGATLTELETEVNELKALLRSLGLMAT